MSKIKQPRTLKPAISGLLLSLRNFGAFELVLLAVLAFGMMISNVYFIHKLIILITNSFKQMLTFSTPQLLHLYSWERARLD
jgi:hypothetical protein